MENSEEYLVKFFWKDGGKKVSIKGSFDNWEEEH